MYVYLSRVSVSITLSVYSAVLPTFIFMSEDKSSISKHKHSARYACRDHR